MKPSDRTRFAENMRGTFSVYAAPVTAELLETWWRVLEPYTMDAVAAAFTCHIRDFRGYGHRVPTPADLVRILEETLPAAMKANNDVLLERARLEALPHREAVALLDTKFTLELITDEQRMAGQLPHMRAINEIYARPSIVRAKMPPSLREEEELAPHRPLSLLDRALKFIGRQKRETA